MEMIMENIFSTATKDGKSGRKWLLGLLETEIVEIEFTKKDGTDGVIVFEKDRWKKDSLAVFDLEKEGWRSFRWDSVKAVRFTLGD
jgi:hypothetical protein